MVEFRAHFAECGFQNAEIYEHSARVQDFTARMGEYPIIVPVQAFAFSVKIGKKMSRRKIGFNPDFIHA